MQEAQKESNFLVQAKSKVVGNYNLGLISTYIMYFNYFYNFIRVNMEKCHFLPVKN